MFPRTTKRHPLFSFVSMLTFLRCFSYNSSRWFQCGFNPVEKYNWIIFPSNGKKTESLKPPSSFVEKLWGKISGVLTIKQPTQGASNTKNVRIRSRIRLSTWPCPRNHHVQQKRFLARWAPSRSQQISQMWVYHTWILWDWYQHRIRSNISNHPHAMPIIAIRS